MSRRRRTPLALVACAVAVVAIVVSPVAAQSPGASASTAVPQLGWQDELTGGADKLDVATTVAPISSLAREIGGDRIRLHGLIPDATNSHTFEPSPSDAKVLSKADLIVVNGLHLEQPTLDLAEASKSPEAVIRFLGDNTITQADWLFDFSFPESAGDPNPHLWMNVQYADPLRAADARLVLRGRPGERQLLRRQLRAAQGQPGRPRCADPGGGRRRSPRRTGSC